MMSALSDLHIADRKRLLAAVEEIRILQAAEAAWFEENQDICGVDDELWFDTQAEFSQEIAEAGIRLSRIVEESLG
jgi:hypothetical protein